MKNNTINFQITEGIESSWNYHISTDDYTTSLCGKRTMLTSIPLLQWGFTPENYHIPESWCEECGKLWKKMKEQ